ncbi:hypothetical protein EMPS_11507 [Entomortierella parvispora]|uniref:Uncharacterized protein n=1 Tax=Entomortierella parvispora TaxID=205924 RepID=A0A9P3M2C4_9FUNG|nr:hypothetical protein EMPS_11507 [Entomortierella parvispora]
MGDVSAGFHVGSFAYDPNAELRKVFEERANQQDGLGSILKYCQDKSGFRPGNTDTRHFMDVLDAEFSNVVTKNLNPTAFVNYLTHGGLTSSRDLVEHLPDNSRLTRFLDSRPSSGNYNRAIAQFITEVEGDFLSIYVIELAMSRSGNSNSECASVQLRSVDRDEMARRAEDLVVKLREKERLEEWARGMSSPGYQ